MSSSRPSIDTRLKLRTSLLATERPPSALGGGASWLLWLAPIAGVGLAALIERDAGRALWFAIAAVYLAASAAFDLRQRRVPNRLVYPAIAFAAATPAFFGLESLRTAWAGGGLVFAIMFALALARGGGMGMGDVKLATFCGLLLGPLAGIYALAAASMAAAIVALALLLSRRAGVRDAMPLAPFFAGATILLFLVEGGAI